MDAQSLQWDHCFTQNFFWPRCSLTPRTSQQFRIEDGVPYIVWRYQITSHIDFSVSVTSYFAVVWPMLSHHKRSQSKSKGKSQIDKVISCTHIRYSTSNKSYSGSPNHNWYTLHFEMSKFTQFQVFWRFLMFSYQPFTCLCSGLWYTLLSVGEPDWTNSSSSQSWVSLYLERCAIAQSRLGSE